ncbi:MAG: hypothetical protein LBU32_24420 [Clostridiales bacterium]|jgi:hypothetical protein|nr:hypothetical protein [Clostridiales bacterium]
MPKLQLIFSFAKAIFESEKAMLGNTQAWLFSIPASIVELNSGLDFWVNLAT